MPERSAAGALGLRVDAQASGMPEVHGGFVVLGRFTRMSR